MYVKGVLQACYRHLIGVIGMLQACYWCGINLLWKHMNRMTPINAEDVLDPNSNSDHTPLTQNTPL